MTGIEFPPLDEFVDVHTLAQTLSKKTFPNVDSVRWYLRKHREELLAAGALIRIHGRLHFHPERFSKTVVAIGYKAASL